MHILLVDDDSFLRDMYVTKFIESGHTVDAVATGDEGLRKMSEGKFDLILLDMIMPNMSGIEFLEQAKAKENKDTIFVVLSNQGEELDREAAKKAGASGYIIKAESIPSDIVKKVEALYKS